MHELGGRYRETCNRAQAQVIGHERVKMGERVLSTNTYSIEPSVVRGYNIDYKRCWDELHPGPPYLSGGPLLILEGHNPLYDPKGGSHTAFYMRRPSSGITYEYNGSFYPNYTYAPSSDIDKMGDAGAWTKDWADAWSYGASAWKRFRPKLETADLGTFLGEAKDIPRMLQSTAKGFHEIWKAMGGSRTHFGPKSVADHWLNTQFGWLPFLSDLRKFKQTYDNADKKFRYLIKHNGRWLKRKGSVVLPTEESEVVYSVSNYVGVTPTLVAYYYDEADRGSLKITHTTRNRVWFEGAYRYWLPAFVPDGGHEWRPTIFDYMRLYGARISPSLVWELTPWSWLIDWVSNVGDVISNITSCLYDNMATKYAFVMRERFESFDAQAQVNWVDGPEYYTWSLWCNSKSRCEADPFGFEYAWDSFSPRQWSILSALGITRTPRLR